MRKRSDGFWGIHSDFHAQPDFGVMGRGLREEDVREICQLLQPDYWQIDTKGHPGWASYPTRLENALPEYACDPLAIWRKVTKEEDVALISHYSGVRDEKYCPKHPEDAVVDADGTPSKSITRTNGGYVDALLIPQLSEMVEKYHIDGIWVDGDCWAVEVDYHPETVAAFERETGCHLNGKLPVAPEDPFYYEYREYIRELYRRYLKHYVDEIHRKYPDFEITSNWMYSDNALEPVNTNVDFLSGDFSPWNCVNWARYAGRALAQQNMPWDLMVWGMRAGTPATKPDCLYVHTAQLIQDAAVTIALGGGFQVDVHQHPDGSPKLAEFRRVAPVGKFMRARESFCFRGKMMHQAVLFLSAHDRKLEKPANSKAVYERGNTIPKIGLTAALCDAGQSLEIASEYTLKGHYHEYPLIIVPEAEVRYSDETISDLLEYAQKGGNLILVGQKTCSLFAEAGAPYRMEKPPVEEVERGETQCIRAHNENDQRYFTLNGEEFGAAMYPVQIMPAEGIQAETVAHLCFNSRSARYPMAVIMPYGSGKIAAIGANLGTDYYHGAQYLHRTLLRTIADKMYTPIARIESAMGLLEIVCLKKEEKLMLQLVNVNGNHANESCATEDMIPPVLDVEVSIACSRMPQKLILQPAGRELAFTYRNGRAYVQIDRIDIHDIIEVIETTSR